MDERAFPGSERKYAPSLAREANVYGPGDTPSSMNATDEWYEIDEIAPHATRIAEGVIFNSFLIEGDDRALLIDTGAGFGDLRTLVEGLTDLPVTVLVSHSHWDHVGAVSQVDDVLVDERELDAEGHVSTDLTGGGYGPEAFAADWREAGREIPDGVDPATFDIEPHTHPETIAPGDTIDLGGRELELLHVPGHSPGMLASLDRDEGVLYGADVVHRQHGLYVQLDGSDIHDYVDTFDRLIDMRDDGVFDTLYISHDRPLSGDGLSLLSDLRDGLQAIIDDDLDYELTEDGSVREYTIAGNPVLTKPDVS